MTRWRSYFVLISAINLIHFGDGSLADVQHVPGEESCELPCVEKIADRIFNHVTERYIKLEIRFIQQIKLQLTRMEKTVEEKITKLLTEKPSENFERKEDKVADQNSTESATASSENPNSVAPTPMQLDNCVQEIPGDNKDFGNLTINASNSERLCVDPTKPATMPSVTTVGSLTTSSIWDNSGENSVTDEPNYYDDDVQAPTTVSEISEPPFYTTTVQQAEPKAANPGPQSSTQKSVTPYTTTVRIGSPTKVKPATESPKPSNTPSSPPFKPLPRTTTSTAKPRITASTRKSRRPDEDIIHYPTEFPETERPTTPKRPRPAFPQIFRYARTYLNGGWTIIHSRYDGSLNFNRSWAEYRSPFGKYPGEYWMGLEAMHQLTKSGEYELLVVLKSLDGTAKTAMYDSFWVGSEASNYRLALGPFVGGDAGDSFSAASGQMFSTYDRDNDRSMCASCAELYHSGWWFKDCADANLNGLHVSSMAHKEKSYGTLMNWWSFNRDYQGLQEAGMLVRKRNLKLAQE